MRCLMGEYKVEYTSIKKEYWCYIVEAENRADAIKKVREAAPDVATVDDHDTASRCQWEASSSKSFLDWFSSIFKG
tara:strand:- start:1072 stop:1299 length:228 start_codon:yes stop_codon:yes gene_type:complete